jgi:hypothetical protein
VALQRDGAVIVRLGAAEAAAQRDCAAAAVAFFAQVRRRRVSN